MRAQLRDHLIHLGQDRVGPGLGRGGMHLSCIWKGKQTFDEIGEEGGGKGLTPGDERVAQSGG